MRILFHRIGAICGLAVAAALLNPAGALAQEARAENPVALEMFLSQACKSCPPAADYLLELSARPDLVVLSYHIDYWNVLSHRKYGRWKDPYSKASYSARQRIYNRKIRDRGTVFTPQAIVSGAESAIGSKRGDVEEILQLARRAQRPASVEFSKSGGELTVTVKTPGNDYQDVVLVSFHKRTTTDVKGGDNAGVVFREPNVVVSLRELGSVAHREETFAFPAPGAGMGCAVLVQERGQGRIQAARYCP